jgi:hypothetical protein
VGTADTAAAAAKCGAAGRVTTEMCKLFKAANKASRAGGYHWDSIARCKAPDSLPWHPSGRACDLTYGKIGKAAKGGNLSDGNKLVKWLRKNHKKYDINHVIWQGRIYSNVNWSGRHYSKCTKRASVTTCHKDHVHVATSS